MKPATPLRDYLEQARKRLATISPEFADKLRYRVRVRCEAEGVPSPEWAATRKRGAAGRARPAVPTLATPAALLEVPLALSAWRRSGEGRVVQVSSTGVVLHELGAAPRRFTSVEAAIAAL